MARDRRDGKPVGGAARCRRAAGGLLAIGIALLVLGSSDAQPSAAAEPARHSGRVVKIGLDQSQIVVEETVAWGAAGGSVVRREVRITPHTSIELLERGAAAPAGHARRFGWSATRMPVTELREGDFVTVTTRMGGHATALQVVRPPGD
jgi:hypothetical protein